MVVCSDISFLFSLYGNDIHTPSAIEWIRLNRDAILISRFNYFELINALRFAEFRKTIATGNSEIFASQFRYDLCGGRIIARNCDLADILSEADRLSLVYTLRGGHRAFDILHVAAARIIGASHFLTFDANQKKLATNEGLIVPL